MCVCVYVCFLFIVHCDTDCSDSAAAIGLQFVLAESDCSQIAAFVWSVWQYFCVLGRRAHCLSSLPLPPSSHHLIKEQGRIQCFLITLLLALGPSFNDETSAQGGLDICFIIIILHQISGAAVCFRHRGDCLCARFGGCLCTRQPFFFIIFRPWLFALRLKIWCPDLERAFFFRSSPSAISPHESTTTSPWTSARYWIYDEVSPRGRWDSGQVTPSAGGPKKQKKRKKQKGREKKLDKSPQGGWNSSTAADVFLTLDCAQRVYLPLEADWNDCTKSSAWWRIC